MWYIYIYIYGYYVYCHTHVSWIDNTLNKCAYYPREPWLGSYFLREPWLGSYFLREPWTVPPLYDPLHSGKTLDSNETELCFTRPRWTDIQRRCPDNTLGRHVGLCVCTTCTVTQYLIQRLHSIFNNSPAFLQAQWFQTLWSVSIEIPVRLPANRRILNLCRNVFHPQSEALCLYVLTLSQNQNISKNIYIIIVGWRILDNVKTRYQQQHISYYFVDEL